ncbi:LysM peptidoglycan-binding domain-containing protein [Peribacillus muralis]|uniref:CAP domain-containing protein n=1 Tax=Peribacillus muralis TaxID=264697 RepID=UPI001F4DF148|nr:CAP domain-containing protein [Peribacillus muralis]MCK1993299.1 CAP domain-containing protein [Peribacillus muralis]MCK2014413.1 CAP domain-containing protein [Peribacillus muralis]
MKKTIVITALSLSLLSPTAALGANTHEVVQGDTLSKIATEYDVSLSDILKTNPAITDSNQIIVGQTINLPSDQPTAKQEYDQTVEQQILRLVNEERSKAGLPNVEMDTSLSHTATLKSEDMRDHDYFNHTSPTYGSPFEMMKSFGITYKYAGENIAAGQPSSASVMKSWMNSPGHKANILNKNYTHIGIGYATGGKYSHYWTQHFIGK